MSRGKSFTQEQDEAICRAYLCITKDPLIGNSQPRSQFWIRVQQEYKGKIDDNQRSEASIKARWQIIQKCCNKFRGCLRSVQAQRHSGMTYQNEFEMAKQTYYDDTGKYFSGMDGCWAILAESIKWQDIKPKRTTKAIDLSESEDKITSPVHDEDTQVPSNFESIDVAETTPCSGSVSSPRKRPSGTKLAKHNKIKNKVQELESVRHINLLETLNKSMAENQGRRIELEERRIASLERQTTCEEKKTERKDIKMEERIMGMDLSTIQDPERRAYYQYRRNAILAKWSSSSSTFYSPDLPEF